MAPQFPQWRDMSIPYTAKEIEQIRKDFRAMPTYNNGLVLAADVPALFKSIGFERTPSQLKKVQDYWNNVKCWNGGNTEEQWINLITQLHNTRGFATQLVKETDVNNDGFISEDEFHIIVDFLAQHRTGSEFNKAKTFADFLTEADTNKDGKVDLEEATNWLLKQIPDINN